jgi:hypothetical protein
MKIVTFLVEIERFNHNVGYCLGATKDLSLSKKLSYKKKNLTHDTSNTNW